MDTLVGRCGVNKTELEYVLLHLLYNEVLNGVGKSEHKVLSTAVAQ